VAAGSFAPLYHRNRIVILAIINLTNPAVGQAFRYNSRKDMTDSDRFDLAVRQIVGKRLTWAEVTGKVAETETPSAN
jgi:hypothetical protein